ncbi:ERC 2 isoform X5 [Pelobates cultripes]|uniref:ERC 2 isoform X5 n=1 Tax=Pelobates cultripes TaxID=61616 RepID=A0AAD1SX21_PELCU|nr:ERC 2 isoform X5 [Pelobates cultripes]
MKEDNEATCSSLSLQSVKHYLEILLQCPCLVPHYSPAMYGSARTITNLEGSPSRSPRLPRSPRLSHRRTSSGGGGGGAGKTLSMENIQSLNAAYATSGPMYLSDHEGVASTTYPKGTMTLGRATNRAMYGGRVTAMGSSPNIASAGLSHTDVLSYTDHVGLTSASHHHHHHQVPSMLRQVRDSTMLDLQVQLKDLQRENELLRKELDIKDSKLGSSMNSIKTFWSPELKKERVLRKEEAARMSVLKEQMRVSHEENQLLDSRKTKHLQLTIQALQDELRTQRDLNHLLQQESGNRGAEHFTIELTEENFRRLQAEHDRQAKELFLLRKTLEEMELRIETQKQTLSARDESIKKLLEMLQSKGLPSKTMEEENEKTRRMVEAESQLNHLEVLLDQKDKENIHLREELHRRNQLQPESAKTKALQTVIEMKDTKIASLERNIRDLEDEIQMIKTNGVLSTEDRDEELKQMEVYKSHSKFMKSKIDQLKQELSKKESELLALQTKLETLGNQNSDCKQHIEVLKESLTAKEQRAAILQTEVGDPVRLKDQDSLPDAEGERANEEDRADRRRRIPEGGRMNVELSRVERLAVLTRLDTAGDEESVGKVLCLRFRPCLETCSQIQMNRVPPVVQEMKYKWMKSPIAGISSVAGEQIRKKNVSTHREMPVQKIPV